MNESEGGYLIPKIIEIPNSRWQLFKAKHFPRWLQWVFPIKVEKIDFEAKFLNIMKEMPK